MYAVYCSLATFSHSLYLFMLRSFSLIWSVVVSRSFNRACMLRDDNDDDRTKILFLSFLHDFYLLDSRDHESSSSFSLPCRVTYSCSPTALSKSSKAHQKPQKPIGSGNGSRYASPVAALTTPTVSIILAFNLWWSLHRARGLIIYIFFLNKLNSLEPLSLRFVPYVFVCTRSSATRKFNLIIYVFVYRI